MGIKNQDFYKATKHYTERANERFGVSKNDSSAVKFFRQHATSANYVGISKNREEACEVWQNDEVVFVVNPQKFSIITAYPTDYNYKESKYLSSLSLQENRTSDGEVKLNDSTISNLERSIDQEIYNTYVEFVDDNADYIERAINVMKTLKRTRRRDYRENQISELESILKGVVGSLKETNMAKERLEVVKNTLVK